MAMTWWRRMAPAKSGAVCVLFSMSAANAAEARPVLQAGAPETPVSEGHFCVSGAGTPPRRNAREAVGHSLDALSHVLGEFVELPAVADLRRP
jgi:hypothetical protein